MIQTDLYQILGLNSQASATLIKKAYRSLALQWHPDRNQSEPQAEERFKKISLAYAVLSNPVRKKDYDKNLSTGIFSALNLNLDLDLMDLMVTLFGPPKRRKKRGETLKKKTTITFAEAIYGTQQTLLIQRLVTCNSCNGFGAMENRTCQECGGAARTTIRKKVVIDIPPGSNTQQKILTRGFGNDGVSGGKPGDLITEIEITPHPILTREGDDIMCRAPIGIIDATLGTKLTVPTLNGQATVTVPAGTQHGTILRLPGQGVPCEKKRRGDQIIQILVITPKHTSPKAKNLLTELSAEFPRLDEPTLAAYDKSVLASEAHED